jgi:hypothetical protein
MTAVLADGLFLIVDHLKTAAAASPCFAPVRPVIGPVPAPVIACSRFLFRGALHAVNTLHTNDKTAKGACKKLLLPCYGRKTGGNRGAPPRGCIFGGRRQTVS